MEKEYLQGRSSPCLYHLSPEKINYIPDKTNSMHRGLWWVTFPGQYGPCRTRSLPGRQAYPTPFRNLEFALQAIDNCLHLHASKINLEVIRT